MADRAAHQKTRLENWIEELLPQGEETTSTGAESGSMPLDLEALEASLKRSIDRRAVALRLGPRPKTRRRSAA